MNLEAVKYAASLNDWLLIFPELALAGIALLLLVAEMVLPKRLHDHIPAFGIAAQLGLLGGLISRFPQFGGEGYANFNGLLLHSYPGSILRIFFVLASILVCVLARFSFKRQRVAKIEFYHIVMISTAAMMLLAQSNHFVLFFVALETLTIGLYILVSYFRENPLTLEAGLKYLISGALSSSLLLFGIVLLYGAAGNPAADAHAVDPFNFTQIERFLTNNPGNFLASAGIVLILSGIAFKIAAFPFQIWVPDVYQGAPTPVTAFLAVSSKAAGFAVLLTLTQGVFAPYQSLVQTVIVAMAATTLIFGNIAALTQSNVKRLIGLSGVSHAGFLLLGVAAAPTVPLANGAIYFYLFAYLLASFAVFGVMTHLAPVNDTNQELDHYRGLSKTHPFLAGVLTVGLGSLAGIPPLAGFMGKFFVFVAAFQAGLYWLLALAIVGVVISIYYYFGWIRAVYFDNPSAPQEAASEDRPETPRVTVGAGVVLGALALATIVLGFYQGPLGAWLVTR
mgnify:CR=1 FL=1